MIMWGGEFRVKIVSDFWKELRVKVVSDVWK
jgi:hypothetical protein